MRREDFNAYAAALRAKTARFKALKVELGAVRAETLVLARTEELLRGRAGDMDETLRKVEEKAGVTGCVSHLRARVCMRAVQCARRSARWEVRPSLTRKSPLARSSLSRSLLG